MNDTSMIAATAHTFGVPGARLHYELRGHGPLVALVGAPMDARAFSPLADLLAADHRVLTTDPRGINRSPVDDRELDSTPQLRADDLARLLIHLDAGPAVVFGSSGGAVTALALAEAHPELVHTVIAHEPPLHAVLEDRGQLHTQTEDMIATYLAGDGLGAWRKFLSIANIHMPDEMIDAVFGGERDPQDLADEHYQYARMLRATVSWEPDVAKLQSIATRILIGLGEDSTDQLCDRSSRALSARLAIEPTMFPGGHIAFAENPIPFAARLRQVLDQVLDQG